MQFNRTWHKWLLACALLAPTAFAQRPTSVGAKPEAQTFDPALVDAGQKFFRQNCAFCHGRDATGGESGPDLTHSSTVVADTNGDKIGVVVRNGKPGGMPKFDISDNDLRSIVAYLHTQAMNANSEEAERRKITIKDLLTGNADAGQQYFHAHCASCHSATVDLKGIAKKYPPVELENIMLYPRKHAAKATLVTKTNETISGALIHADEFTISVRDPEGWPRSFPRQALQSVRIDDPLKAHLDLLPKYTDAQVHDLFAYLETLK